MSSELQKFIQKRVAKEVVRRRNEDLEELTKCEYAEVVEKATKAFERNQAARDARRVYADLGLTRVVGALGGVYYE